MGSEWRWGGGPANQSFFQFKYSEHNWTGDRPWNRIVGKAENRKGPGTARRAQFRFWLINEFWIPTNHGGWKSLLCYECFLFIDYSCRLNLWISIYFISWVWAPAWAYQELDPSQKIILMSEFELRPLESACQTTHIHWDALVECCIPCNMWLMLHINMPTANS